MHRSRYRRSAEIVRGGGVSALRLNWMPLRRRVLVSDEAPVMPEFSDEKYECIKLNRDMKFRPCAPNVALPQARIVKDDAALWAAHEARDAKKLCALAENWAENVDAPQCIKKSFISKVLVRMDGRPRRAFACPSTGCGRIRLYLEDIPEARAHYRAILSVDLVPQWRDPASRRERAHLTCDNVVSTSAPL